MKKVVDTRFVFVYNRYIKTRNPLNEKLQPWQQNKVDTLTKSGKVTVEQARSALEDADWDVYEAAKEIVKNQKKVVDTPS